MAGSLVQSAKEGWLYLGEMLPIGAEAGATPPLWD